MGTVSPWQPSASSPSWRCSRCWRRRSAPGVRQPRLGAPRAGTRRPRRALARHRPPGRDLFVRTLHGVRVSLLLSVLASLVSLVIGVLWGAVAGLAGGRTDGWMMRLVDVLYSLPYLFIVIILTTLWHAAVSRYCCWRSARWVAHHRAHRSRPGARPEAPRVHRGGARRGVPAPAILLRHIVPNLLGPVLVYATLIVRR